MKINKNSVLNLFSFIVQDAEYKNACGKLTHLAIPWRFFFKRLHFNK